MLVLFECFLDNQKHGSINKMFPTIGLRSLVSIDFVCGILLTALTTYFTKTPNCYLKYSVCFYCFCTINYLSLIV